jgi:hypothetical protein
MSRSLKWWLKTVLVAAGGGIISALTVAFLEHPFGFFTHYKFGEGRLALALIQGAAVAVVALFLKPPRQ